MFTKILVVILVIVVIYFIVNNLYMKNSVPANTTDTISPFMSSVTPVNPVGIISPDIKYDAPVESEQTSLLGYTNQYDGNYVYSPADNAYVLPFQYLDFTIPYHRWMYYFYPNYYSDYYYGYWPYNSSLGDHYHYRLNTRRYPNIYSGFGGGRYSQRYTGKPFSRSHITSGSRMGGSYRGSRHGGYGGHSGFGVRSGGRSGGFGGRSGGRSGGFGGRSGGFGGRSGGHGGRQHFENVCDSEIPPIIESRGNNNIDVNFC